MKHRLFTCKCGNVEHQLIFSYFEDFDNYKEVYVSVHLCPETNIWKRLINGIKYIFGYRSKYGHFDEFIFNEKDVHKLEEIIKYLKG